MPLVFRRDLARNLNVDEFDGNYDYFEERADAAELALEGKMDDGAGDLMVAKTGTILPADQGFIFDSAAAAAPKFAAYSKIMTDLGIVPYQQLTQSAYDALSTELKNNGTLYGIAG